eukprot:1640419-Alexandrium_andersonii.AAC.1
MIIEAVSTSAKASRYYPRKSSTQAAIPEKHFHIVAIRVEGLHPSSDESGYLWGAWVPQYMDW